MKTKWDYSTLADAYLKRPDYSVDALTEIFSKCGGDQIHKVCDIGAGVAHLTLHLARKGFDVVAIEPNDNMRSNGIQRTKEFDNVFWVEATGEETHQKDQEFDFVSFGSSFNVTDRMKTMEETHRILKPGGWFTCMWNHRVLEDPVQQKIENIISSHIDDYDYGTRREDQSDVIKSSGLFENVQEITGTVEHKMSIEDCVEAWRSHGTLQRQSDEKFEVIIAEIENYLNSLDTEVLTIPYVTRAWIAQRRD